MKRLVVTGVLGLALVGACGTAHYVAPVYDTDLYAESVCVNHQGIRVSDSFCPIGVGVSPLYGWNYFPYRTSANTVSVPYVGYPVGTGWSQQAPVNITNVNIQRGDAPEKPPAGSTATTAPVLTQPAKRVSGSSTVTRGGLGVPAAAAPTLPPKPPVSVPKPPAPKAPAPAPKPPAPKSK